MLVRRTTGESNWCQRAGDTSHGWWRSRQVILSNSCCSSCKAWAISGGGMLFPLPGFLLGAEIDSLDECTAEVTLPTTTSGPGVVLLLRAAEKL
jgi:hypothetical protein